VRAHAGVVPARLLSKAPSVTTGDIELPEDNAHVVIAAIADGRLRSVRQAYHYVCIPAMPQ